MADSRLSRSPVFIVGMPRSGTTLLSSILDAHPQIAVSPETHFYTRCRTADPAKDTPAAVWNRLRQQPGFQDMAFTEAEFERVQELLDQEARPGPAALLEAVGRTYAERSGAETWGEKTPDHLDYVPTILEDFPEAAILCIVRDPRDVCLSLRGMPWNRDSLPESAWKWRRYARLVDQYKCDYPNHFRQIRYEDLLCDAECVIRDILEWLNTPFSPAVFDFHEQKTSLVDAGREPWKQKVHSPLDYTNREKWRTEMGPAERWVVQQITGKQLENQGYPVPPVSRDGSFLRELLSILTRTGWMIGRRIFRRWATPSRHPDDYRPAWIRRKDNDD